MDSSNFMFIIMLLLSDASMTHGQSSYPCSCLCGSANYEQGITSSTCSGQACASACLSALSNSGCTSSNTYGCCTSTSSCAYYSSSTSSGTCNCVCNTYSIGTLSVGSGSCTTNNCQTLCASTYSSGCGVYGINGYCIGNSGINIYKSCPLFLLLVISILSLKTL